MRLSFFSFALFLFCSSFSYAGTFTPAAGTTVNESPLTISWNSTEPQQWVRAFNSSGEKFFDSGRQFSASGQVQIDIPSTISSLRIVFYERVDGVWSAQDRIYPVDIDDFGGMPGQVTVSDRISCETEAIDLTALEGSSGSELHPTLSCNVSCPAGEFLIATDCVATVLSGFGDSGDNISNLTTDFAYLSPSAASCNVYGQFESFIDTDIDSVNYLGFLGLTYSVKMTTSGACMSLPQ